jgi:predicted RNA-binding Zn ribbon-like protein
VASVVVDGLVLPIAVGGHPALDFCNTRAGLGWPPPKEYLASHAHLALWAAENGLMDRAEVAHLRPLATSAEAAAVLARALRLREALRDVLVGSGAAGSWAEVNAEVRAAAGRVRLVPSPSRSGWELASPDPGERRRLALPLLAVAWSAADLLVTIGPAGVAACPGDGCGWLFHDPRGRRRWCSMAWCGNRAKARRHAARMAGLGDEAHRD